MPKPVIALDADGVLLDYHHAYARAWARAFGRFPAERDPQAYWPMDRWHVERLEGTRLTRFAQEFGAPFWGDMQALPGALDACRRLAAAGYELVCVSAIEAEHEGLRHANLRGQGFPIARVVATGHSTGARSPKADAIEALAPVAFVDDFLPYLRGMPQQVHTALVLRAPNGSPNEGPEVATLARSVHADLAAFVDHWLADEGPHAQGALPGAVAV